MIFVATHTNNVDSYFWPMFFQVRPNCSKSPWLLMAFCGLFQLLPILRPHNNLSRLIWQYSFVCFADNVRLIFLSQNILSSRGHQARKLTYITHSNFSFTMNDCTTCKTDNNDAYVHGIVHGMRRNAETQSSLMPRCVCSRMLGEKTRHRETEGIS